MNCQYCENDIPSGATKCPACGAPAPAVPPPAPQAQPQAAAGSIHAGYEPKNYTAYLLLGIFLGALGVHNFYAGYTRNGVIQLLITICSCGYLGIVSWIWAIVEVCTVKVDANKIPMK